MHPLRHAFPRGVQASQGGGICDLCGGELTERDDDRPETVRARLVVYHEETEPLKHFYEKRGKLDTVPGDLGTIEDTTRAIKQVLEASH